MCAYGWYGQQELDPEQSKLIILAIAAVLFVISTFVSWHELRYLVSGRSADATITRIYVDRRYARRRYGPDRPYDQRVADYSFDDAGTERRQSVDVPMNWPHKEGQLIKVQYVPGVRGYVRLYGDRQWWWLLFFFATTGFLAFHTVRLVRDARAYARERAAFDAEQAAHRGPSWVQKPPQQRY